MVLALLLWIISIMIWFYLGWWYFTVFLFVLHLAEVFLKGVKVGKKAGKPVIHSVIMTLIFGYTWWLPIQKRCEDKK